MDDYFFLYILARVRLAKWLGLQVVHFADFASGKYRLFFRKLLARQARNPENLTTLKPSTKDGRRIKSNIFW